MIESGRCWVINKAELTHSEDCNLASKIDKCNPAYTNRVLAFSILPALQRDKAQYCLMCRDLRLISRHAWVVVNEWGGK